MPVSVNFHRNTKTALMLGAVGLLANMLFNSLGWHIPLGNIFVFAAAMAFGLQGALTAFALAVVPGAIYATEYYEILRLLMLCAAIGYAAEMYPRFPSFLLTMLLWLLVFGPLCALFPHGALPPYYSGMHGAVLMGFSEVLLVMVSGAMLINPTVWGALTRRPRPLELSELLSYVVPLISALCVFITLMLGGLDDFGTAHQASSVPAVWLMAILTFLIVGPMVIAWRLSRMITGNFQHLFASNLFSNGKHASFSGLSSEYWRRKTLTEIPRDLVEELRNGTTEQGHLPAGARDQLPTSGLGICALNRNGTIGFVNRKFRHLTGISSSDIIGRNIESVGMNPELCRHIAQLLESTFQKGPRVTELKLNQLPSSLRFLEIASQRSEDFQASAISDGPDSVIITIKDITDRRTVESHLLQAQRLTSLGNGISSIAHAFNNALTAITGHASFAVQAEDLNQVKESLRGILSAASNAGDMVRKLLDYAEGKPTPTRVADLGNEIESRLELLRKISGENYQITLELPDKPVAVACDTNLIIQAVNNLVMNSKDAYSGKSGRIHIALDTEYMDESISWLHPGAQAGNYARLKIRDWGHGMSSEILSRAFDPMFSTRSASGHAGIGLSMVFAIVRAHDGFMAMESHPEKGTTVTMYLPVQEGAEQMLAEQRAAAAAPPAPSFPPELQGNRERILVVEDEPHVRELVSKMLTALNTRCQAAATAKRP